MDKLNKKLIKARKKISKIDEKLEKLRKERKKLQDMIHIYFDSEKHNTSDTEKYILIFWSKAYSKYKDGGFITNDDFLIKNRFNYEIKKLDIIINEDCKNKKRALDIACGNGRYTRKFAENFDEVIGIDLSKEIINKNNEENTNNNIKYINENFITMNKDALGNFDFIYVGGLNTCTNDNKEIEKTFKRLIKLLNKDGVLILREGTKEIGYSSHKSVNYVAYHRNIKFYKKGIFKKNFLKAYRNYGYNLYHLEKFFTVNDKLKKEVNKNPLMLEQIVKEFISKEEKSNYFFLYRK